MEVLLAESENKRKRNTGALHPEIPDKLYFRIGEVARLLQVAPFVLRFWESEFPQLNPGKGGTGQRLYRRRDVELAVEIRRLLYDEGYTIPGARQLLQGGKRTREPAPASSVAVISSKTGSLRQLRQELQEIASILSRPVLPRQANTGTRSGYSRWRERAAGDSSLPLFTTTDRL